MAEKSWASRPGGAATRARRAGWACWLETAPARSRRSAHPYRQDPPGPSIPFPGEGLAKVPTSQRVPWDGKDRAAFIKEWYDRGYSTPEGGWSGYDIHHIRPREFGGTNDFDNLVPIPRDVHQQLFNSWWRDY